jgi:CSLREA domain-containing protein
MDQACPSGREYIVKKLWIAFAVTLALVVSGCVINTPPPTTTTPAGEVGVSDFGDSGDGVCDEESCTLREAIDLANSDETIHTIELPPGTFVVGGGGVAAASLRSTREVPVTPASAGHAFHITSDVTILGSGQDETAIDFSGDDYSTGWLTEASLTLSSLTVRNLGSGTEATERNVVAMEMATADESVNFTDTVVEHVQPGMSTTSVEDPTQFRGAHLTRSVGTGQAADVTVRGSVVRRFGPSDTLVSNAGGSLTVEGSTFDDVPALAVTGSGLISPPSSPAEISVANSSLERTASITYNPDGATYTAGCFVVGISAVRGFVSLLDSMVLADSSDTGPCGGSPIRAVAAVAGVGTEVDVNRSLLRHSSAQLGQEAALNLLDYQTTDSCVGSTGTVSDSTLDADSIGLLFTNRCEGPPPGIDLAVQRSTIAGYLGLGLAGEPTFASEHPKLSLQGSVLEGEYGCAVMNPGGAGLLETGGYNMATSVSPTCYMSGPGDAVSTDLQLGPLQDNGGPTQTREPLPGSPLIDTAGACSALDQRGINRPQGAACDRGAVEVEQATTPPPPPPSPPSTSLPATTAPPNLPLGAVASLIAGDQHTCALLDDASVRCWGSNFYGQLGNGSNTNATRPVTVPGLTGITSIAGGMRNGHTCAVLGDQTVRCWGLNANGQLGDGTTANSNTPVAVPGLSDVVAISAGHLHTCAVLGDGTVSCWGAYDYTMGVGSPVGSSSPTPVPGLSGAVAITSGENHTCVLINDGTARCWGVNLGGALGNGTTANSSSPVTVIGLVDTVELSAGRHHTCAITGDGTALCWGLGDDGELGDGTDASSSIAVTVPGLSGSVAIGSSYSHSCALKDDGTVRCWGSGRLGDGTNSFLAPPVVVSGVSDAVGLTVGGGHSCALIENGTARCWGGNLQGQIGNGTTVEALTSKQVLRSLN